MKRWIKDGVFYNGSIILGNFRIFNPTDEQLIDAGYIEYVAPPKTFEEIKNDKINELISYDASSEINEFFIGEDSLWLDKNTRAGLMLRFNAEKAEGQTETTLWYDVKSYTLPIDIAINMLYMIELYASECYDNTSMHKLNISNLQTEEEVYEYDFTVGYPEKLHFENSNPE